MNTNVLTEHALSVIYRHACRTYQGNAADSFSPMQK